jgi:hypothetical protein
VNIEAFAKLLQFSISPIALISGASLLLLSITNRLGRTIDRSRILVRELEGGSIQFKEEHKHQLRILMRRSRYLRTAVLFISISIFLASLMIMGVFIEIFVGWALRPLVLAFLFISVLSISAAAVYLVLDVSAGLKAMHLEVDRHI